jgi:tetratricopeptide (TPR) repeat protein
LDSLITNMQMDIVQATIDAEVARATRDHPDSLDKRDLMFGAKVTSLQPGSKTNLLARIALNEQALALDPDYVWALREKALNLAFLVRSNYSSDREADLARATKAADRALQLAPNDVNVLRDKAVVLQQQGHLEEAAALLRKVIEQATRWGWARRDLGETLLMQGHYGEALENFVIAKRLIRVTDPESLAIIDASLARGLLVNDRFSDAIDQARLAIAEFPPETGPSGESAWLTLIAAESASGHDVEAGADLQKYLANPEGRRTIAEVRQARFLASDPKLLDHLRRAGMPAE